MGDCLYPTPKTKYSHFPSSLPILVFSLLFVPGWAAVFSYIILFDVLKYNNKAFFIFLCMLFFSCYFIAIFKLFLQKNRKKIKKRHPGIKSLKSYPILPIPPDHLFLSPSYFLFISSLDFRHFSINSIITVDL